MSQNPVSSALLRSSHQHSTLHAISHSFPFLTNMPIQTSSNYDFLIQGYWIDFLI